jgi:hypothetical protein
MNKVMTLLLASVFVTASFAASHMGAPMTGASAAKMPEAQTQGSAKPKAAAEARHEAKTHGTDPTAKQPEAMKSGSDKAQAKAEAKHLKKAHTGKKNSTDEQMKKDAAKL